MVAVDDQADVVLTGPVAVGERVDDELSDRLRRVVPVPAPRRADQAFPADVRLKVGERALGQRLLDEPARFLLAETDAGQVDCGVVG